MEARRLEVLQRTEERCVLRLFDAHDGLLDEHDLDATALQELLAESERRYRTGRGSAVALGQRLYHWLNPGGSPWLDRMRQDHRDLCLYVTVAQRLRHLPWELLQDRGGFLCADPNRPFTPVRRVHDRVLDGIETQNRSLRILFMASSPVDVQPVLAFENEEALILEASRRAGLDLVVEESGSLEGLKDWIDAHGVGHFDVVHFTGHAEVEGDRPVFVLENRIGQAARASAEDIADVFQASNRFPRLLFLSGCRTGAAPDQDKLPSLCEKLVEAGVPAVLGWALPVGDRAASQAAEVLYERLASGVGLDLAVAHARRHLYEKDAVSWHLLRLYADATPLTALVTPRNHLGRAPRRHTPAQRAFLDAGGKVEVCARERFVGRRRELQKALRVLCATPGEEDYAEGVLLHGMGGLGKSSLAARLSDRLASTHERWVWAGAVDEAEVLRRFRDRIAEPEVHLLLEQRELSLAQRLQHVLENRLAARRVLFVFDDFEQNLEPDYDGVRWKDAKTQAVLDALVAAIHESGSDSRVIVTSRYVFPIRRPYRLEPIEPPSLTGADLRKKTEALPRLREENLAIPAALRERAIELAAGNPRLLERMDAALHQVGLDREALLARLAATEAAFREELILATLLGHLGAAERRLIALLGLYRLPIPIQGLAAIAEDADPAARLNRPVALGLIEVHRLPDAEPLYYVSPLVTVLVTDEWVGAERQAKTAEAARALSGLWWEGGGTRDWERVMEVRRLALAGQVPVIAAATTEWVASGLLNVHAAAETARLCAEALALVETPRLHSNLARAEAFQGNGASARRHYEEALALSEQQDTADRDERAYAALLFHYAGFLIDCGRSDVAESHLARVADSFERLGDVREKAIIQGKIADILQARGQLDEALRIRREEELPVYERLGDVRSKAVTLQKIAGIVVAQGQLEEGMNLLNQAVQLVTPLGSIRDIAVFRGGIANILQGRGQLDEALRIRREEELPVYERLGDVRERLVCQANTAFTLVARGQPEDRDEIARLLAEARAAAEGLRIPEAEQIRAIQRQLGLEGA
jgi:CHAT domain-containing protein/tetratricopeptide (TPR) repeat protein